MAHRSDNGKRGFSAREVRALLWLLPVLAVASWLVWQIGRPALGKEQTFEFTDTVYVATPSPVPTLPAEEPETSETPIHELFTFDPNTVEYHDLVRLGFSRSEALGIVKYRERGKIFEIPEDFAACYQVSEAMYRRLAPYIRIGEKFRLKPFSRSGSSGNNISRQSGANAAPTTDFGEEDSTGSTASPTKQGSAAGVPLSREIEINTADSATLRSVSGIGEVTVMRIIEYRARLGGFTRVEQLAEVRGVTEQNYERILGQIFVDDSAIQKIDINFASASGLARHPYMRAEALRKLLKQRQLKGGWRTVEELGKDDIFTTEELVKLGPYLIFN